MSRIIVGGFAAAVSALALATSVSGASLPAAPPSPSLLTTPPVGAVPGFGVFAPVPAPGQPESVVVARDGTVYTGSDTHPQPRPDGTPSSRLFAFSPDGKLKRQYVIENETTSEPYYGLFGLALDAHGTVYALENGPPSIIAIDPRTGGKRVYARFPNLPRCETVGPGVECQDTKMGRPSFPDHLVFGPDGSLYVTDNYQALIWRVPPGGGKPQIWFSDPGLEGVPFGPNDDQFSADGRTLYFNFDATTGPRARKPGLYALSVEPDGRPGELRQVWESGPFDIPDGLAIGRSGRFYISLAGPSGDAIAILAPDGQLIERTPATEAQNLLLGTPLNRPAGLAFLGDLLLLANHSFTFYYPPTWAILKLQLPGETGITLFTPDLAGSGNRRSPARVRKRPHRQHHRHHAKRRSPTFTA